MKNLFFIIVMIFSASIVYSQSNPWNVPLDTLTNADTIETSPLQLPSTPDFNYDLALQVSRDSISGTSTTCETQLFGTIFSNGPYVIFGTISHGTGDRDTVYNFTNLSYNKIKTLTRQAGTAVSTYDQAGRLTRNRQ